MQFTVLLLFLSQFIIHAVDNYPSEWSGWKILIALLGKTADLYHKFSKNSEVFVGWTLFMPALIVNIVRFIFMVSIDCFLRLMRACAFNNRYNL